MISGMARAARAANVRRAVLATAVLFALGQFTQRAVAASTHPFHKSLSEIELNAKRGKLEVSLWLWPPDLEQDLAAYAGKKVDLDTTPKIDALLARYVAKHFVVKNAKGKTLALRWVGKELKLDSGWLYFELDCGKKPSSLTLRSTLLTAIAEKPMHVAQFLQGRGRKIRNLTRQQASWSLPLQKRVTRAKTEAGAQKPETTKPETAKPEEAKPAKAKAGKAGFGSAKPEKAKARGAKPSKPANAKDAKTKSQSARHPRK